MAERLSIHDPERTNLWAGLAMGLGVTAVLGLGVVIVLLFRRRSDDGGVSGALGSPGVALSHVPFPQAPLQVPAHAARLLLGEDEADT